MSKKELFDEVQETIMIVGAIGMWMFFEYFCFKNVEYGQTQNATVTRTSLITIITNLFTFKFTKSQITSNDSEESGSDS